MVPILLPSGLFKLEPKHFPADHLFEVKPDPRLDENTRGNRSDSIESNRFLLRDLKKKELITLTYRIYMYMLYAYTHIHTNI